MGEAKQKRKRHLEVLKKSRGCIYCAESNPAVQVDHMPPRMMFRQSQRPKGLEFPSCAECNQGTSRLDVVASFLARTFPGIQSDADDAEWDRVMREVKRVAPSLLREMWLPEDQMKATLAASGVFDPDLAMFRADGPVLSAHMQAYAAKVGFALRFEDTGAPVPLGGAVQVRWFTSGELLGGDLPSSLLAIASDPMTLRQGKLNALGVFEYGWDDFKERPRVRLYYAKVRNAFAVAAFVADLRSDLPFGIDELATFSPGDISEEPTDRLLDRHSFT